MKLLVLASCLVASILYQAEASTGGVHWTGTANAQAAQGVQGKNYGRNNGYYGDDAARSAAKGQHTDSGYGSRASNWDQNDSASKQLADQAAAASWRANNWGARNYAKKGLDDRLAAQGNQWYKGHRNNDGIDYAYDKSYNIKDSEDGGFEFAEKANSRALDDLRDRAASYDRNVEKDSAWASGSDAQKADRKAAASQNAAASDSNWDKFARTANSASSANGRDKDWAQKVDQSQGANRLWTDARKSASDIYKDLATADGSYKRNARAFGGKRRGAGDNVYAYGVGGETGYAAKPNYYVPSQGYAKAGAAGDVAQAWDQAAKTGLRQTDAASSEDLTKASFSKDQWLNDRVKGFDRANKAAADDKGFSDWAKQSAKTANKFDAASADAASKWNKDQSKSNFDEDLWKKEAEKKRLSERDQNKKVYKKWYNNKNKGGDNWERLKYDRDQADDSFGYDTAAKKVWAQNADQLHDDHRYDAGSQDSKAARAAAAHRASNSADWKKDAAGYQNANANANDNNAVRRKGYNNEAWKKDQAQNAYNAQQKNQGQWHYPGYGAGAGAGAGVGRVGGVAGVVGVAGVAGRGGAAYVAPAAAVKYVYPANTGYYGSGYPSGAYYGGAYPKGNYYPSGGNYLAAYPSGGNYYASGYPNVGGNYGGKYNKYY